jgi:hypothetical protein
MQLGAIFLGLIAFMALGSTVIIANLTFGTIALAGLAVIIILEKRSSG